MPRKLVNLRKLPDPIEGWSLNFYDDPLPFYINNHLYKDTGIVKTTDSVTRRSTLIVYAKDIEMILGLTPHRAEQLLLKIQKLMCLSPHFPVTIATFCECTGIDEQTVNDFIEES